MTRKQKSLNEQCRTPSPTQRTHIQLKQSISSKVSSEHEKIKRRASVRAFRASILRDLEQMWIQNIDDNVRRILSIGAMMNPRFKKIQDTAPDFTEHMIDTSSVSEFELLCRWVPKAPEAACFAVNDSSKVTATNSSLTPTACLVEGRRTSSISA